MNFTNSMATHMTPSLEEMVRAMREIKRQLAPPLVALHSPRPFASALFDLDEVVAAKEGSWTPDIVDDFQRWWVVQLLRHGFIDTGYVFKMPDPVAVSSVFPLARLELPPDYSIRDTINRMRW